MMRARRPTPTAPSRRTVLVSLPGLLDRVKLDIAILGLVSTGISLRIIPPDTRDMCRVWVPANITPGRTSSI